jgi:hypothetical protein
MTEQRNDGGPAFPVECQWEHGVTTPVRGVQTGNRTGWATGMSLRDYMAVHSTQPGIAELCKVAGVGFDGYKVYTTASDEIGIRFDDWWRAMTLEQMCELSAKVRYAEADAMLKVREAK